MHAFMHAFFLKEVQLDEILIKNMLPTFSFFIAALCMFLFKYLPIHPKTDGLLWLRVIFAAAFFRIICWQQIRSFAALSEEIDKAKRDAVNSRKKLATETKGQPQFDVHLS